MTAERKALLPRAVAQAFVAQGFKGLAHQFEIASFHGRAATRENHPWCRPHKQPKCKRARHPAAPPWPCKCLADPGGNSQSASRMNMEPWQAFILGVIEGITEYLPVSSTGHLLVAQHFMGIGGPVGSQAKAAADAFAVCIQGGAILAVLGLYWRRVLQMMRGVLGQDAEGLKLAIAIVAGFLPAAVIGLLISHWIKAHLFGMWPVIGAWVIGGLGILVTAWWRRNNPPRGGGLDLPHLTWQLALVIGLLQCVAMCPGTSRSLMTICGGLLVGLSVSAAVEYSFLLGVLTLTAATVKEAGEKVADFGPAYNTCLLYTSPSPRDGLLSRMPSSA